MRTILIFIFSLGIFFSAYAEDTISIQDAHKKGLVSLEVKGKGGFTGKVIWMKIKNLFTKNIQLKVEAGRRLNSVEESEQDILVNKSVTFQLMAGEEKTIDIYGMCCQMHNGSPKDGSVFEIGKMADANLIKLAKFIDKYKYNESGAAQHAVWVLSDSAKIEGVQGTNKEEIKNLRNFLCGILKIPIPWYTIEYEKDTAQVFSDKPKLIRGEFEYYLNTNALVTMAIYSKRGQIVQFIYKETPQSQGRYVKEFMLFLATLPRGTYFARIYADGNLVKERILDF